ncbi:hypothetical protein [Marinobacter sp.]|uniref:hypothetical protein n=1 Tax=Marinobacter sp. TaxID=50741 RepID=UPI003A902B10
MTFGVELGYRALQYIFKLGEQFLPIAGMVHELLDSLDVLPRLTLVRRALTADYGALHTLV